MSTTWAYSAISCCGDVSAFGSAGLAVITGAVDVYEMLAWAKAQREKDPGVFIAGIR